MSKFAKVNLGSLVFALFLVGCSTVARRDTIEEKTEEEIVSETKQEETVTQNKQDLVLDNILKGMKKGKYEIFSKEFTPDLKNEINEKKFAAMNKALLEGIGEYKNREYLGYLRKGVLTIHLWKCRYSKTKNSDLLVRMALGEVDDKMQVFSFGIYNQ